jgi:putative DNA primase/helicase
MKHRDQLAAAMLATGTPCPNLPIDDGELHRFHIDGDKRGSQNGWYVLHGDGVPAGTFGSWKTGLKQSWCAKTPANMSEAERQQHRQRMEQSKHQRQQEQQRRWVKAASRALSLWDNAGPASGDHPYLVTKRIPDHHLRQHEDELLIPLYDGDQLVNLQRIGLEGGKRFLFGGKIVGCSSSLGRISEQIQIVEGWATAFTIFSCTGQHTAAAMTAGNLKAVALHYQRRHAGIPITISADNDRFTPGNPGIRYGTEAARAVNGKVVWPTFPNGADGTDWNDLANLRPLK